MTPQYVNEKEQPTTKQGTQKRLITGRVHRLTRDSQVQSRAVSMETTAVRQLFSNETQFRVAIVG